MPGSLFYGDDGEYTFDRIEHLLDDEYSSEYSDNNLDFDDDDDDDLDDLPF